MPRHSQSLSQGAGCSWQLTPRLRCALLILLTATCFSCQTGRVDWRTGDGGSSLAMGQVVKGPVAFATVTAYALDAQFDVGEQLASTTCDASGNWSLNLPLYSGHILFVASNGSYTDEAAGVPVPLGESQLVAVVHDYLPDQSAIQVTLSPISHWARALARYWVSTGKEVLPAAVDDAYTHLNAHFGGLDWRAVQPTDFNTVDGGVGQDDADCAGLILAGLSQEALAMAARASVTPGVGVTGLDLVNTLADDLGADGYFDGVGSAGPIHLPTSQPVLPASAPASATPLDGQTVRGALAANISAYLQNPLDASGLTFGDVRGLLNELSSDSDSQLFRQGGTGYDTTPPLLAFSQVPALYVPDASYTLSVLAADPGSGVANVFAQTGSNPPLAGVAIAVADAGSLADGGCVFGLSSALPDTRCVAASLYRLQLSFPSPAHYPYVVYAVDRAGNSTQTNGTSLSFTITYDNAPPEITTEGTTVVYWDERGMSLVMDAGLPLTPARYLVSTQESSVFAGSHDVYKAGTRLSWGAIDGGPTGAQLDNQDPSTLNVPFIPYDIPFDSQVDAPIVSVTYSAECTGTSCGAFTTPATGSLIFDGTSTASARFLMPLTSDALPGLAQISGPATLSISVTATDGAGNATTKSPDTVTFHVIGPPVALVEDTGYPTAGDLHSTFPYTLARGTYAGAFDAGSPAFAPDGLVRLVRYLAFNPEPQPVAMRILSSGTWAAQEEWDDDVLPMSEFQAVTSTGDGLWCPSELFSWSLRFDLSGGRCQNGDPAWPCPGQAGVQRLTHASGYHGCVVCDDSAPPVSHTNLAQPIAAIELATSYYANPGARGAEGTLAPVLGSDPRYVVVPPADGGVAGALAVYVNRTAGVARSIPLVWQNIAPAGGGPTHYQNYVQDFWTNPVASTCVDPQGGTDPETTDFGARYLQNLDVATGYVTASLELATESVSSAAASTGCGEGQTFAPFDVLRTLSQ